MYRYLFGDNDYKEWQNVFSSYQQPEYILAEERLSGFTASLRCVWRGGWGEREREKERKRQRTIERERETAREKDGERERERERESMQARESEREREQERERERARATEREREMKKECVCACACVCVCKNVWQKAFSSYQRPEYILSEERLSGFTALKILSTSRGASRVMPRVEFFSDIIEKDWTTSCHTHECVMSRI